MTITGPNQGTLTDDYWVLPKNNSDDYDYPKLTFNYKCYDTSSANVYTDTSAISGSGTISDSYILCIKEQIDILAGDNSTWDKIHYVSETREMDTRLQTIRSRRVPPFPGCSVRHREIRFTTKMEWACSTTFKSIRET